MRVRKKWCFTWAIFIVGSWIAFRTNADLPTFMSFATIMLGGGATADIVDKKLNGAQ